MNIYPETKAIKTKLYLYTRERCLDCGSLHYYRKVSKKLNPCYRCSKARQYPKQREPIQATFWKD